MDVCLNSHLSWLLPSALVLGGLSGPPPPLVEVTILIDVALPELQERSGTVYSLYRDLRDNLQPYGEVQLFAFGDGATLVSLTPDELERSIGVSGRLSEERTSRALREALVETQQRLCRQRAREYLAAAVIVIGGNPGKGPLVLPGSCRFPVYVISATPESDQPLRELSSETRGKYFLLKEARGYAIAESIRVAVWRPSFLQHLRAEEAREEISPLLKTSVILAVLLLTLVVAITRFVQNFKKMEGGGPSPSSDLPKESTCPIDLPPAANLVLRSGSGSGAVFKITVPFIVGGRQHAAATAANFLLDDPLVAPEHCEFYVEEGSYFVLDRSGQGISINDELIEGARRLAPGDWLRVGEALFEFVLTTPPAATGDH